MIPASFFHSSPLEEVDAQCAMLKKAVNLVSIESIKNLQKKLTRRPFIFQMGECAESLADTDIDKKIDFYQHIQDLYPPALFIGRMAGQLAKPRSSFYEDIDGKRIQNYMGDMINGHDIDERHPDPKRLVQSYNYSRKVIDKLSNELDTYGDTFFTSHEALCLDYEKNFLERDEEGRLYDTSAHMLWLGKRSLEGSPAHIDFIKKVYNPVGLKISEDLSIDRLQLILDDLSHNNHIVLIMRYGVQHIENHLPQLLKALKGRKNLYYMVDPMHGNTYYAGSIKTRAYHDIKRETELFFQIMNHYHVRPDGIHLEVSHNNVTECIDNDFVTKETLNTCYTSLCDPRLNKNQTLNILKNLPL